MNRTFIGPLRTCLGYQGYAAEKAGLGDIILFSSQLRRPFPLSFAGGALRFRTFCGHKPDMGCVREEYSIT